MASAVATGSHSLPSLTRCTSLVAPNGRGISQLLGRLARAERYHGDNATVLLDDPYCLFDRALLVGAHREAELTNVHFARVRRQNDPRPHHRHALHADENVHAQLRTRRFSGSKSGVEPTTSTVTG